MHDLTGEVAFITGGAGVLCSRFSRVLSAAGARVVLMDRDLARAESVAASIREEGGEAWAVRTDVLDRHALEEACREAERLAGPCTVLVNGAGGNHPGGTTTGETCRAEPDGQSVDRPGSFFRLAPEGVRFVLDLNFTGTFLATQVVAAGMADRGKGVILNISSMNAFRPLTRIPAYSAAKAAVSNLTQWMAVHLAPCGIRVNAMAPGFFIGDQNRGLLYDEAGNPTPRAEKILAHTPMGRFGVPEDLDGTLLWLCDSRASGFVTGVVVPIDGGFSSYSGV